MRCEPLFSLILMLALHTVVHAANISPTSTTPLIPVKISIPHPKININTASIDELRQIKGIGQIRAQRIIEYRQQHGKFTSIEMLSNVKGISPKLIERSRTYLTLQ